MNASRNKGAALAAALILWGAAAAAQETGSETASETGSETGSGTAPRTGPETGPEMVNETVNETGARGGEIFYDLIVPRPDRPVTILPGTDAEALIESGGMVPGGGAPPKAGPRQEVPLDEAGQPRTVGPDLRTPAAGSETAAAPAGEGGVVAEGLESIDPESVGLIGPGTGGFERDMWRGTSRDLLRRTIPMMPVTSHSPVVRTLARRLLLSGADVPEGNAPDSKEILELRVERLLAAGFIDEVLEILARAGVQPEDRTLKQHQLRAQMLSGDYAGACRNARAAVRRDADRFWVKTSAFCKALDGDVASARLTLDLLSEQGEIDPIFARLMERVIAVQSAPGPAPEAFQIETAADLNPLYVSMMRALDVPLAIGTLEGADPLLLKALATMTGLEVNTRLEAAGMAARAGTVSIFELRQIFGLPALTADEIGNALSYPLEDMGARAQAVLYQSALSEPAAGRRSQLLARAWQLARTRGMWPVIAMINMPVTAALPARQDLAWIADDAVRALVLGGRGAKAAEWWRMARRGPAAAASMDARQRADIWALLLIAGAPVELPYTSAMFEAWWQAQAHSPNADRLRRGRTLFALLEALGRDVPEEYWSRLIDRNEPRALSAPRLAAWRGMVRAANAGRRGETALLALVALQDDLDGTSISVISSAVGALQAVGLADEARALAAETALQRGL